MDSMPYHQFLRKTVLYQELATRRREAPVRMHYHGQQAQSMLKVGSPTLTRTLATILRETDVARRGTDMPHVSGS